MKIFSKFGEISHNNDTLELDAYVLLNHDRPFSYMKVCRQRLVFPGGPAVKNPPTMQETQETPVLALSLGGEDSPGGGHGNPLDYSFQENPVDRGAWWISVHRVTKESDTTEVTEQQQ